MDGLVDLEINPSESARLDGTSDTPLITSDFSSDVGVPRASCGRLLERPKTTDNPGGEFGS